MKKVYISLAIIVIIIGLVINFMFDTQYPNFQIVGVKLERVTIIDSSIPKGNYYLLKPEIRSCNGKRVFMGGSLEPGIYGCAEKIEDIVKIMQYGVMRTPALVINEKVAISGSLPSITEIKDLISKNL